MKMSAHIYFFGFILLFWSHTAAAYIDPGSGSFVMQMIFASLVGGYFALKIYYQKIKQFIFRTKKEEDRIESDLK